MQKDFSKTFKLFTVGAHFVGTADSLQPNHFSQIVISNKERDDLSLATWKSKVEKDYFVNVTDNDYDKILYKRQICGKTVCLYA